MLQHAQQKELIFDGEHQIYVVSWIWQFFYHVAIPWNQYHFVCSAMQCDPQCSNYNPCIDSCPVETCDNMMHPLKQELLCKSEMCVEGCKLKECPDGMVYQNDSYVNCVAKATCKPICLHQDGITYYEGDVMSSDACHTCKCTRGSKICTGVPCKSPVDGGEPPGDLFSCETGWTQWINQDSAVAKNAATSNYFKQNDLEPLPTSLQFVST